MVRSSSGVNTTFRWLMRRYAMVNVTAGPLCRIGKRLKGVCLWFRSVELRASWNPVGGNPGIYGSGLQLYGLWCVRISGHLADPTGGDPRIWLLRVRTRAAKYMEGQLVEDGWRHSTDGRILRRIQPRDKGQQCKQAGFAVLLSFRAGCCGRRFRRSCWAQCCKRMGRGIFRRVMSRPSVFWRLIWWRRVCRMHRSPSRLRRSPIPMPTSRW